MNDKKKIFLLLAIILILISGIVFMILNFNADKDKDDNVPTPPIVSVPEEPKEEKKVQIIDLESNTRPIAIMINNHKTAQPLQTGLNDAYLVYEIITEGGISRMLAVFKDKTTAQIGTVRSSRHYFLDYALENDAIYVHFGWSPQAQSDIKTLGINNINGLYDAPFWRDKTLKVPTEHTVYTSMEKLSSTIAYKKYRTTTETEPLLNYNVDNFSVQLKNGAKKADKVVIKYSDYQTNTFEYDSENKVYKKYSNGELRTDRITGEAFTAKNIITYQVKNYSIDSYGRQDLENVGSGDGYFITNGYAVPIKWKKDSRSSQTVYTYNDGTEIKVNDGNTYIQIQPLNRTLEISANETNIETDAKEE